MLKREQYQTLERFVTKNYSNSAEVKTMNNILYQIETTCTNPTYDLIKGRGKEAIIVASDLTLEAVENIVAELNELTEHGGYSYEEG